VSVVSVFVPRIIYIRAKIKKMYCEVTSFVHAECLRLANIEIPFLMTLRNFFFVWVLKRDGFDSGADMFVRKIYKNMWNSGFV
jgi:hypothetical protein